MPKLVVVAILVFVAMGPGDLAAQNASNSLKSVVNPAEAIPEALPPPPPPDPEAQTPEELAKTADLLLRVAQLMMVRLEGTSHLTPNDRQLLDQIPVGGVIIPQVVSPSDAADYITSLRSRHGRNRLPMFIGIDLMGTGQDSDPVRGHGMRVPAMLTVAAGGAGAHTSALFDAQASDVATMGADFHWGPSLAMPQETDRVESLQTFGTNVATASALSRQIAAALKAHNLTWVPVGFPGGLQDAKSTAPPILVTALPDMRKRDLQPYAAAIQARAGMLHVGTTLAPTLDPDRPACLSPVVIGEVVRDVFRYEGIVVAGPMDSPQISRIADTSTAAAEALMAGADMIYWEGSGPRVARAIVDIVKAVQIGALSEVTVNRAFTRVVKYKTSRELDMWPVPDAGEARKLAKVTSKRREPTVIERRAITLLRNQGEVLPLSEERSGLVGVTGTFGVVELRDALEEYFDSVGMQWIRTARHLGRIEDFEVRRIAGGASPVNTAVAIFSRDIELPGQLQVIAGLKRSGKRVIVVLMGYPADLNAYNEADALVLAYGDVKNPGDTMVALADMLVGNAPVEVLPPMRDLESRAGEPISFDVHDVVRTPVGRLPISFEPPFVEGYGVSYRSDMAFDSVAWVFGDGKRSRDPAIEHAYAKPGTYVVTLRIGRKGPDVSEGSFRVIVK